MRQTGTMGRVVTLRGSSGSSRLMCPRWRVLAPEGNAGLRTAISLIGAGTVGAIVLFKFAPKLMAGRTPTRALESEATSSIPAEKLLTVPGLQNIGNNCFLNVILQALASSQALLNFMDACAELTTEAESKSQWTGNHDKVSMPLAIAVSSLIKELSQLGSVQRTSSPRRVMLALSLYVQHFDLASQQDAAEALIHLASALQEERGNYLKWLRPTLQSFVKAPVIGEAYSSTGGRNDCNNVKGGDQLLDSWRGHLPWPLEGTIASSLTCQRCGYQFSTQFQSFNDITLTPSCDREGNMIRGCSLESCLDHFTRPEWVDSVKCSNCSHKAALLSIFLKSGESMMAAAGNSRRDNHKVSRSKVKYIEECGCDEDCNCEVLTKEEGGVWRNFYANASKELKIGRSPEVLCFQIQRVVMSNNGAMKKLTGHVNFPRVLDLFPYTVTAKDSTPLRGNCSKGDRQDSLFLKELQSRSTHSSVASNLGFVNKAPLLYSEISCKGGADLRHPLSERRETMDLDGKGGSLLENSATKVVIEAESEKRGSAYTPASALLGSMPSPDLSEDGEKVSKRLCTEPVSEVGDRSKTVEDSTMLSVTFDHAIRDPPQEADLLVDRSSVEFVPGTEPMRNEESTAQSVSDTSTKQKASSDGLLESNNHCELVDEVKFVQHSSTKDEGIILSTSNVAQTIYSQYTSRMLPPILQQLSSFTTPYEGQQLSAGIHGNLKKLPALHSMPKSTTRFMARSSKYSRKLLYELVSVVVHQGGPQNGHYLVYRKMRIRGSKQNPTNKGLCSLRQSTGEEEENGEKREAHLDESTSVPGEQPGMTVSAAEGGKAQSFVHQLFELESLPDITSSKRFEPTRSRVQVSEEQELFKSDLLHSVSTADNCQALRTSGTLGKCGKREDANALWFRVSDTNVQRVHEQEVFSAHASLLFYEQL